MDTEVLHKQNLEVAKCNSEVEDLKKKCVELQAIASRWQSKYHKAEIELLRTRAKVYEVLFLNCPLPENSDIKAQITKYKLDYEEVLRKLNEMRSKYEKSANKNAKTQ